MVVAGEDARLLVAERAGAAGPISAGWRRAYVSPRLWYGCSKERIGTGRLGFTTLSNEGF